jgi:hypothetical protein
MFAFAERGLATRIDIPHADLERINQINAAIGDYVIKNSLEKPKISFDRIADFLNWGTLRLSVYERQHRLVDFDPLFGHNAYGIFATPRQTAQSLFAASDIIVLTDSVKGREAPYPINTKIQEYWNDLRDWTTQNRILLFSTSILDVPHATPTKLFGLVSDSGRTGKIVKPIGMQEWPQRQLQVWPPVQASASRVTVRTDFRRHMLRKR